MKKHSPPPPGPGRPKGVPNKLSGSARENIGKVYQALGDIDGHVKYLKAHPKALADFYSRVYPQLLAVNIQHSGDAANPIQAKMILEIVHTRDPEVPGGNGGNGGNVQ